MRLQLNRLTHLEFAISFQDRVVLSHSIRLSELVLEFSEHNANQLGGDASRRITRALSGICVLCIESIPPIIFIYWIPEREISE